MPRVQRLAREVRLGVEPQQVVLGPVDGSVRDEGPRIPKSEDL